MVGSPAGVQSSIQHHVSNLYKSLLLAGEAEIVGDLGHTDLLGDGYRRQDTRCCVVRRVDSVQWTGLGDGYEAW